MQGPEKAVTISIIVPCWREDAVSEDAAACWLSHPAVSEVLVAAAGGVAGDTTAKKLSPELRIIHCSRPGRGHQMNEAARVAHGDVLLFHHADTQLLDEHLQSLSVAMANPEVGGGAFRRHFDERHPHLRWIEPWEALRCQRFGPLFGDQSIFVRRTIFQALAGYADVPLMEDVEFTCRLRRRTKLVLLTPSICSSARKHLEQGRWRTTLTNALFLLLYVCGASPRSLHDWYYQKHC